MFAIRAAVASVAVLVVASSVARAADPDVRVVREGSPLTVSNPARVADLLVAVVESSSVNSTKYFLPKGRWDAATSAPSLVHVKFPSGRTLRVMDAANREWQPTPVEELLIVVPGDAWPDHVMLKTATGILSVTKFAPCPLVQLTRAADLAVLDKSGERYGHPSLPCGEDSPSEVTAWTPPDIRWFTPTYYTDGRQRAQLYGDSSKGGDWIDRVKIPAGSRVLPHTHPDDEIVTVVEGTWYLGIGETFDEAKLKAYPAGSFIRIPAHVPHFLAVKEGPVIVQASGHGLFRTDYLKK